MSKDTIYRQEAIDVVKRLMGDSELSRTVQVGLHILPSAQPEIIRCKDCRNNHWCNIQEAAMAGDNFFCGAAERRTDERSNR